MSDETFEYITTDYLISVNETTSSEPVIEYIVELGEQGLQGLQGEKGEQGFSPVVDYIWNTDTIQFTLVNQDETKTTPNLYDYVLKSDGGNATSNFTVNNIKLTDSGSTSRLSLSTPHTLEIYNGYGQTSTQRATLQLNSNGKAFLYGYGGVNIQSYDGDIQLLPSAGIASYNGAEIATKNNIQNSTITIKQGNIIKGSFTLNQSEDGTIELDSGGGSDVETNKLTDIYYIDDTHRIVGTFLGVDTTYDSSTYTATVTPNFTSHIIRQNYDSRTQQWLTVADQTFYPFVYDVQEGNNITITKNNGVATISSTGGVEIDDTQATSTTTYSSNKIEALIQALSSRISTLEGTIDGGNP